MDLNLGVQNLNILDKTQKVWRNEREFLNTMCHYFIFFPDICPRHLVKTMWRKNLSSMHRRKEKQNKNHWYLREPNQK